MTAGPGNPGGARGAMIFTVAIDGPAAAGYVAASAGGLKVVGDKLGREDFGFIFPKGSDLVAPVNAAIAAMKADGTMARLDQVWLVDYKMGE